MARLLVVALLVLGGAAPSVPAAPRLLVTGDAEAWREVKRAYHNLTQLRSFRVRLTMLGTSGIVEVVNPDRTRTVMDDQGTVYETIQVGKDVRFRLGGYRWECREKPTATPSFDPRALEGSVHVRKVAPEVIDLIRTKMYLYTVKRNTVSVRMKLAVIPGVELPRRLQTLAPNGSVQVQLDYFDFNAPITIMLPACTKPK